MTARLYRQCPAGRCEHLIEVGVAAADEVWDRMVEHLVDEHRVPEHEAGLLMSHPARTVARTDAQVSGPVARQAMLLAVIAEWSGEWTTIRVHRLYRVLGIAPKVGTARGDLKALADRGALVLHDACGRRFFTLRAGGGAGV
ncbi:hypothetical protein [Streptomyces sp. URMC 124]|uniref:hypothetical protein n=1 Tax=Streptomyces sp. URMC 124 TaxID=3423405 RepID=UPI003F1A3E86